MNLPQSSIHYHQFIESRWGEFSKQGATTVWETWNTDQSLSHGWSATPAVFASRHILGVQRAEDTGEAYHILPRTSDCSRFQGRVVTRSGIVQVEWADKVLKVHLPAGIRFYAGLPGNSLRLNGEPIEHPVPLSKVERSTRSSH